MSATDVLELRKKLGLTQEQLAEKLGVTHTAVCCWERGTRRPSGLAVKLLATLKPGEKKNKR